MSDYETFMIILTTASLIVSTLTYTHKKQPPCSLEQIGGYLSADHQDREP